jgi:hypothetical protein
MILPILLVFLITAGLSLGQSAKNTSIMGNNTTIIETAVPLENETSPASEMAVANETTPGETSLASDAAGAANASETSSVPNLNYIWSVTGIEPGQVTMVLNQEGTDLFGQAKYEPDSGDDWNGEVVGSIAGDKVDLTLTAQKGKELVTTKMSGIFANEGISGNFSQVSGGKMAGKGAFSAMWINPDTSSYAPATIEQPKSETAKAGATDVSTSEAATTNETPEQPATKSRFVDVHEYADKIGPGGDLSGVPPGMGGGGLN